ncbi:uncharacterized protein DUF2851 [Dyadobacter jejuensis]|uniref:Uncharacterized protein DUF2851 n=1 Tax=Dyadobacter jejuensis TaxID=1082580 RepID=A0A316AHY1_9BACT|nr:DUF2851 family protein [Dyadobacter jejuensis]PWJ57345.1 uncharacterized protein DUF2851 [Dyadobacter jejuensis]
MNEEILSFIWQFQYFEKKELLTDEGQAITVHQIGQRNRTSGPDFSGARLALDQLLWVGDVEIHVNASDWHRHQHGPDHAYESVILHVVWNNDQPVARRDGTLIPTLTLNGLVRQSVITQYHQLVDSPLPIPCADQFEAVSSLEKLVMLDRVLLERLQKKADKILEIWTENLSDWEETVYQLLGQHFGFKLNEAPFARLCSLLPWRLIRQQKDRILPLEALLFGTAGLIPEHPSDDYGLSLQTEYAFLSKKYQLHTQMVPTEWKLLRLRPVGFPTIRIAQFAQYLAQSESLFTHFVNTPSLSKIQQMFHLKQSPYWVTHHQFEKTSTRPISFMGKESTNTLIINVVAPLLVAYGTTRKLPELIDRALLFLVSLPAENNRITRLWKTLDMNVGTAADSQALLEWHAQYCSQKKCLQCTVGAKLIERT